MRVLWVYAHPEPRSLNAALRHEGLRTLTGLGHEIRQSDLYAMRFDPVVDRDDFGAGDGRLIVGDESRRAYEGGRLSDDIVAEQEKLLWSDTVVLQFPLWWFGMPAILKGWFDRVFVKGFGYGVTHPDGRTKRYGDGVLSGRRALVVVTAGSPATALGPRGINGDLEELLFPLLHGTLWYAGMAPLAPLLVPGADRPTNYHQTAAKLRDRLIRLPDEEPLPYRHQDSDDYDENLVLCDDLATGESGLSVHCGDRRSAVRDFSPNRG
ncbi:NAD(P)H-dependent oxidoreductase [Fodinicola acaciae]|uniref:NAD(P)H-dependent oxidoreductase n=1 Tax=Fodinicola acaciae TaxID=2681555 RepID=UPI0013D0DA24|nr:NAD(P)H-dependent oxidoreductase [Fodinicola acaciae]